MAIFMYRERMALEEDPYHQFMSDGAQLWRCLTPHGENFTFRDHFKELPIEIQRKKEEAKRMRVEKAQEKTDDACCFSPEHRFVNQNFAAVILQVPAQRLGGKM